jgi:hypothetical protein
MVVRKNVTGTESQWAVADSLAREDAASRKENAPNLSRLLMELVLAERARRDAQRPPRRRGGR